jgi:Tfp pilus assembly protein PilO
MMRPIIAIIATALAGAIFFLYTQPAYDQVQATQAQIDQYNAALDKAAELQQLKQTLLSRYNAFNPTDLANLQKLLPDDVDNVGLILDLDNLASRYGLALENVDVSSSAAQTTANQTAIGAVGTSDQKYDSLTLAFGTRGTYANFVQFMGNLQSSLRILDLVSLTVADDTGSAPGAGTAAKAAAPVPEPVYDYNITLRTYWLK